MRVTKKILIGFLAITIIVHSLFIPLALPGYVICIGENRHLAIEPETNVQHEHNNSNFKINIQTFLTNKNCLCHLENCFDISLDRDNDYQKKHSKRSHNFFWKFQNIFGINQEENIDHFLTKLFFINLNTATSQPFITIKTTRLLI